MLDRRKKMATPKPDSISTKQFLEEFNDIVEEKGIDGAAKYFGVTTQWIRSVRAGNELPGPIILKKMRLIPVKNINYRYERVKENTDERK